MRDLIVDRHTPLLIMVFYIFIELPEAPAASFFIIRDHLHVLFHPLFGIPGALELPDKNDLTGMICVMGTDVGNGGHPFF